MPDDFNLTNVLLSIIGFLIVYVLNGIKTEIKDIKSSVDKLEDSFDKSVKDLETRVVKLESACTHYHP